MKMEMLKWHRMTDFPYMRHEKRDYETIKVKLSTGPRMKDPVMRALSNQKRERPTVEIAEKALPRLAMFHGGGSTSQIFQLQCEALEKQLASHFEFVYFDAPHESAPGAGILPFFTFEKWGPYLNWFVKCGTGEEYPDGTAGHYEDEEGIDRVIRMMKEIRPGGKWVGCFGFSQGTRVVAGLLLWYQQRRNRKITIDEAFDLQFGVLCMGAGQPMRGTIPEHLLEWDQVNRPVSIPDTLVAIPTLHLHGRKDSFYDQGKSQMTTHFDPRSVTCIEIDYHHAMPWNKDDVNLLAEQLKKMLDNCNHKTFLRKIPISDDLRFIGSG